jgi:hypothetical protein
MDKIGSPAQLTTLYLSRQFVPPGDRSTLEDIHNTTDGVFLFTVEQVGIRIALCVRPLVFQLQEDVDIQTVEAVCLYWLPTQQTWDVVHFVGTRKRQSEKKGSLTQAIGCAIRFLHDFTIEEARPARAEVQKVQSVLPTLPAAIFIPDRQSVFHHFIQRTGPVATLEENEL